MGSLIAIEIKVVAFAAQEKQTYWDELTFAKTCRPIADRHVLSNDPRNNWGRSLTFSSHTS